MACSPQLIWGSVINLNDNLIELITYHIEPPLLNYFLSEIHHLRHQTLNCNHPNLSFLINNLPCNNINTNSNANIDRNSNNLGLLKEPTYFYRQYLISHHLDDFLIDPLAGLEWSIIQGNSYLAKYFFYLHVYLSKCSEYQLDKLSAQNLQSIYSIWQLSLLYHQDEISSLFLDYYPVPLEIHSNIVDTDKPIDLQSIDISSIHFSFRNQTHFLFLNAYFRGYSQLVEDLQLATNLALHDLSTWPTTLKQYDAPQRLSIKLLLTNSIDSPERLLNIRPILLGLILNVERGPKFYYRTGDSGIVSSKCDRDDKSFIYQTLKDADSCPDFPCQFIRLLLVIQSDLIMEVMPIYLDYLTKQHHAMNEKMDKLLELITVTYPRDPSSARDRDKDKVDQRKLDEYISHELNNMAELVLQSQPTIEFLDKWLSKYDPLYYDTTNNQENSKMVDGRCEEGEKLRPHFMSSLQRDRDNSWKSNKVRCLPPWNSLESKYLSNYLHNNVECLSPEFLKLLMEIVFGDSYGDAISIQLGIQHYFRCHDEVTLDKLLSKSQIYPQEIDQIGKHFIRSYLEVIYQHTELNRVYRNGLHINTEGSPEDNRKNNLNLLKLYYRASNGALGINHLQYLITLAPRGNNPDIDELLVYIFKWTTIQSRAFLLTECLHQSRFRLFNNILKHINEFHTANYFSSADLAFSIHQSVQQGNIYQLLYLGSLIESHLGYFQHFELSAIKEELDIVTQIILEILKRSNGNEEQLINTLVRTYISPNLASLLKPSIKQFVKHPRLYLEATSNYLVSIYLYRHRLDGIDRIDGLTFKETKNKFSWLFSGENESKIVPLRLLKYHLYQLNCTLWA